MAMKEINPKELSFNPFYMISDEWMLVTAGDEKKFNTMTASWGGVGVMWGKNVVSAVIRPQRYTRILIEAEKYFTLSVYDEQYRPALSLCGSKSGRDVDKAKETGLTPVFTEKAPYFEQAKLVLVCRKLYVQQINPACFVDKSCDEKWYANKDYHYQYVAEIEKVLVRE